MTDRAHKAAAVANFLQRALVAGAIDVTQLEAMARGLGLLGKGQQIRHAKPFKKAKKSLGIRSIREGFGSTGKWAWLLPAKPVKPAKKELDRTKDANTREQARSAIVNLNGLPAELLSGRIPPHWDLLDIEYFRRVTIAPDAPPSVREAPVSRPELSLFRHCFAAPTQ